MVSSTDWIGFFIASNWPRTWRIPSKTLATEQQLAIYSGPIRVIYPTFTFIAILKVSSNFSRNHITSNVRVHAIEKFRAALRLFLCHMNDTISYAAIMRIIIRSWLESRLRTEKSYHGRLIYSVTADTIACTQLPAHGCKVIRIVGLLRACSHWPALNCPSNFAQSSPLG